MFESITIQRLSVGSVYKIFAIGCACSFIPFSVLMGVLALFGQNTVTWNGRALVGITGLVASPFIGVFLAALLTGFLGTMAAFGLWVFSKFREFTLTVKKVSIEQFYKP